jgi:protease I
MDKLLTGRKIIVLAEDLYEDLELWYPVLRLREEGAEVVIAGTGALAYKGKNGYPVTVDTSADKVAAGDFDAVVIPGGYAPDRLRRYPAVLSLVRDMFQQGKIVAAICHAAWVPISAGIMKGRRATCFSAIKDDVMNAGAQYEDAEVVRDGNLITSRQPSDLGAFCREIISALTQGR